MKTDQFMDEQEKSAMVVAKKACRKLWHDFHLGTEAEFELWWRFNMEG